VNFSLPRDAVRLLHGYATNKKAVGKFIGDLIFEYDRQQSFKNFYEEETARQHKKLAKLLRQTAHAMATCE
jgi:hypothetical protein